MDHWLLSYCLHPSCHFDSVACPFSERYSFSALMLSGQWPSIKLCVVLIFGCPSCYFQGLPLPLVVSSPQRCSNDPGTPQDTASSPPAVICHLRVSNQRSDSLTATWLNTGLLARASSLEQLGPQDTCSDACSAPSNMQGEIKKYSTQSKASKELLMYCNRHFPTSLSCPLCAFPISQLLYTHTMHRLLSHPKYSLWTLCLLCCPSTASSSQIPHCL